MRIAILLLLCSMWLTGFSPTTSPQTTPITLKLTGTGTGTIRGSNQTCEKNSKQDTTCQLTLSENKGLVLVAISYSGPDSTPMWFSGCDAITEESGISYCEISQSSKEIDVYFPPGNFRELVFRLEQ